VAGHELGPPPRPLPADGKVVEWDPGDPAWWRVYHRDYRTPEPLHRRTFGPLSRFDHHQAAGGAPAEDPDGRSVLYLGCDRAVACAEVFWDQRDDDPAANPLVARVCTHHRIAQIRPRAPIGLLSIVGADIDLIGALPALSTCPTSQHTITQAWARSIYDEYRYRGVSGIKYRGAHDFGECMVLWDCAPKLELVQAGGEDRDLAMQWRGVWERVLNEYSQGRRSMTKVTPDRCPRCRELGLR
jgi:hypothetical protein